MNSLFVAGFLAVFSLSTSYGLNIAAFNVQTFGQKKSTNQEVMQTLTKIIKRYDVILIQEIKDNTDSTINNLINVLNKNGAVKYRHETSERLGSSNSKEQYSFLIRSDSGLTVLDRFQYPQELGLFERAPFSIRLRSTKTAVNEFVLTGVHIRPDSAVKEIGDLIIVHTNISRLWRTDNILIMGDMNADCNYASQTALRKLDIRKDPPFIWLIPDDGDTTVAKSKCAYDRFILTGTKLNQSLVANSAKVFLFDQEYGLTVNQTLNVSDHYPIELRLGSKASTISLDMTAAASSLEVFATLFAFWILGLLV